MHAVLLRGVAPSAVAVALVALLLAAEREVTADPAPRATTAATRLQPVPVSRLLETDGGPGPRYLRSDGKGRVYLLHGGSLAVYRVSGGAVARKPDRILDARGAAEFVSDAASCAGADSWILLSLAQRVRMFARDEQRLLPSPQWFVSGVACPGGSPMISVTRSTIRPPEATIPEKERWRESHLLYTWKDDQWEPFLARPDLPGQQHQGPHERFAADLPTSQVVTAAGRDGSLWLAHAHQYHVQRVSRSGRVVARILDEGSHLEMRERTKQEIEQLQESFDATGDRVPEGGFRPVARRVVAGVAEAADGMVYFLVETKTGGGSLALDRYNPVELKVDRAFVDVPSDTKIRSFVAGSDGLYLATPSVSLGAWWLPWDELDQGDWEPVHGLTIE